MRARSDDHGRRGRRSVGLLMPRRSIPTSDGPVRRPRSRREGDGGARSVALKSVALGSGRRRTKRADVPGPVRTVSDGPLVFDRGAAVLARGEREIHLTNTEFRLLSVLAENAGRVLSRSSLLEHVWERGFFGDERIVDVHVRRLRKKLEREPSEPSTLVTVRGLGYRLDLR